ncbi:unnamed protein product (macronuclear) [Paramecium tetraurelia]|uniref:Heme O synthase n=1 Tax=Paramecium tetraurelia TaxID=5888 RepID=A0BTZ2_PARTE|nr:uncharacterized protein GSPATT00032241001 [Paramecium tetraurelia]CAK62009.1 unnamed protein product [Paramecium tetraurelia]|eukprot:XP_001429407.1 hypothetical protein (macronuclear) [Paramecium tetraurelia strain d4-2]
MKITITDLKILCKFSLASGNAVIPFISFLYLGEDNVFSLKSFSLLSGSLFMAMASQAFNQVIEWKQDKLMTRTCNRPIPIQRLTRLQGGLIGFAFYAASNVLMYNYLPTNALAINNLIFFSYLGIYTTLKTRSPMNTLIGAVIGALPVVLGAACVSNDSLYNLGMWGNFGFMFSWQINHFYGIYWKYQKDYLRAGFKMVNDSAVASRHMKMCLAINGLSWFGTASQHSQPELKFISCISGLLSLYFWNYRAIKLFEVDPSKNANYLKKASYNFLLVYYSIILMDIGIKRYQKQQNH